MRQIKLSSLPTSLQQEILTKISVSKPLPPWFAASKTKLEAFAKKALSQHGISDHELLWIRDGQSGSHYCCFGDRKKCIVVETNNLKLMYMGRLIKPMETSKITDALDEQSKLVWQLGPQKFPHPDNPRVTVKKRPYGVVTTKLDGKLHSVNDEPAIEHPDGTKYWYQNGKLHRDGDKPAIEHSFGTKLWYQHDELIHQ